MIFCGSIYDFFWPPHEVEKLPHLQLWASSILVECESRRTIHVLRVMVELNESWNLTAFLVVNFGFVIVAATLFFLLLDRVGEVEKRMTELENHVDRTEEDEHAPRLHGGLMLNGGFKKKKKKKIMTGSRDRPMG